MASIVKLSIFSLKPVGRTVSSGAGAKCAHRGSLRGPGDARPDETSGRRRICSDQRRFPNRPRYRSAPPRRIARTHADIPDIVWADDETGCYAVGARDAKGNRIVVERFGPIKIVSAKR